MEIEVKASQVLRTGTNKSGEWELIKVVSQDGTEYTTFDKKVKKLGAGAVIDIGEPTIKEGKISFKEIVKVVKEGQAAVVSSGNYQADPVKMASEERRSRMHAIKELWIAGKFDAGALEVIKLRKWLMEDATKTLVPAKTPGPCLNQPPYSKAAKKAEPADSPFPDETPPDATTAEGTTSPEETPTEGETADYVSIPKTIQALYNWIASHGRKYGRTWFLANFGYTEEELRDPAKVEDAYNEVKSTAGWEK